MSLLDCSHNPIRADIVQAARKRFQHYGYKKTNLCEIAADVNMSAGNLYRYFDNKQDIAIACCAQIINERMQELRDITQDPHLSAAERIRAYASTTLSYAQSGINDLNQNNELAKFMTTDCPDLIHKKFAMQIGVLGAILLHGNNTGEFNIPNVHEAAKVIHAAFLILEVSDFILLFSEQAWEARIITLTDCLLNDLS